MTRGIKAGNTSMVEALVEKYNDLKSPETAPLTLEQGRKILFSLSPDSSPLLETDVGCDLPKEKVFEMVQPALERLVRQVERTFEHFATVPGSEAIGKIFVTGAMNIYQPIVDYVGSQLGITSEVLDPLGERGAIPVCLDVDDTHCLSERIAFVPALGMAISDNEYTPNLLFTYRDKERAAGLARFNRTALAVFVVLAVICTGIFAYQSFTVNQKTKVLEGIEKQVADLGPPIQRDQLAKMAAKVREKRQLFRSYAEQYLDMVLLSELTTLTPRNIRFIDLKLSLGQGPAGQGAKEKGAAAKGKIEGVTVEGLIVGERRTLETNLAGYMRDLNASPIFHQITIEKNTVIPYLRKQEALHFILNLKVEGQVHG